MPQNFWAVDYNFRDVEAKWQKYWSDHKSFKTDIDAARPKFYVLDMFPYPSGAGLHVGHPLGYIASDIYARFKRLKGFNVLHPMGFDAFGLPAEQYAIQTGQHPAVTTEQNIKRYKEQLNKIGFSFDWDREVRTSDPEYYKWTQWIFIQLFKSWYNRKSDKAESIESLIKVFETDGNKNVNAVCDDDVQIFSADEWKSFNEKQQQQTLLKYRLAYLSDMWVNWCAQLGTVLANEEVKDGVSERGGYPVERKLMKQWCLRITAYAERLLNDLETIDWSESIKEAQRNWIGRSEGSSLKFKVSHPELVSGSQQEMLKQVQHDIEVFTTRPDTIFGVTFLTLAPEHELVNELTTDEYRNAVNEYVTYARNRSERERISDVKRITGQFTGAYALHPFTGEKIPIWIGEYVLAGYGTGAVMAVPAGDQRDWDFAKHFNLPIIPINKDIDISEAANATKDALMINSSFLNGMTGHQAIKAAIIEIEKKEIGKGKTNYRLRDAIFGRQRYWGEPIPVYYKDGVPYVMKEEELPLVLPEVDKFLPTETGEPPLARAKDWNYETTTMPGWAGSSWYYLRYMDAHNGKAFVGKDAVNYWQDVDLYLGGAEHATGHLLYVRFWTKFLYDLEYIPKQEPAKKLINQGMIQGVSAFVYRLELINVVITSPRPVFISKGILTAYINKEINTKDLLKMVNKKLPGLCDIEDLEEDKKIAINQIHVDVSLVENNILNIKGFQKWREEFSDAVIITEQDGKYICGSEVEKMSKRWHNVVNPDDIVEQYGADCLRMYEMFLGPLEQSKPWNTNGISGVSNFIRKLWRLYHNKQNEFEVSGDAPTAAELKTLHKTIKKVEEDIDRFSFNTSVSTFMICVNELTDLKCNQRAILEPLSIILSPYAPHVAEELWSLLGHKESITKTTFPKWNEQYLVEDSFEYPVSFNGKVRFKLNIPLQLSKEEIEKQVITSPEMSKFLNGDQIKKVIVVPGRIVNIVV